MLVPLRILISKWDSQCDMKKVKYFGGCTWEKYLSESFFSYITLSWEIYRIQRNGYHWRKGAQWKFPTTEEVVLGPVWYMCLNTCFQFLNNIACISTNFFTHVFPKNTNNITRTTLPNGPLSLIFVGFLCFCLVLNLGLDIYYVLLRFQS